MGPHGIWAHTCMSQGVVAGTTLSGVLLLMVIVLFYLEAQELDTL